MAKRPPVRLLNVRLGPEDAALVTELRQDGVELSSLVRDAIRTEYGRRRKRLRASDIDGLLAAVYARHPDPAGPSGPRPDIHDRRAFREAVRGRVRLDAAS